MSGRIRERVPLRVPVLLIVVAAVGVACSAGDTREGSPGGAGRVAAPTPTIEQEVELGGVALADYCRFHGYGGSSGKSCYSEIGPDSSTGQIKDKTAYCEKMLKLKGARAVLEESTWVCRKPIDMGEACDWQYGGNGIQARETDGTWTCVQ